MQDSRGASAAGAPSRHRSSWIRVLIVLVIVLLVLVGLDRLAEVVVARRLAATVQTSQGLAARPHVTIHGFPFVTQVLHGRYRSVSIASKAPIVADGIGINDASARLHTVRVGMGDAWHGTVDDLPVESGSGQAVVPYSSLDAALRRYGGTVGGEVNVVGAGRGRARLTGPLGLTLAVTARVREGRLSIRPDASDLQALPDPVRELVSHALMEPLPLPPFPFHVRLASGAFEPDGLHLAATSRHSVFPVR